MNKALIVILATVAIDAIGGGLIFPILPDLLAELTAGGDIGWLYGAMLASYAAMQFVFSPVLGALSDRFGRRPVLLLSLAGTLLDYLVMALSPLGWVLWSAAPWPASPAPTWLSPVPTSPTLLQRSSAPSALAWSAPS